jgi:serpin B
MSDISIPRTAADFSDITHGEALHIDSVIHKAKIIVNEEGTEAAAATAISMKARAMVMTREEEVDFFVDRPFMLVIRDRIANVPLFAGQITNL